MALFDQVIIFVFYYYTFMGRDQAPSQRMDSITVIGKSNVSLPSVTFNQW